MTQRSDEKVGNFLEEMSWLLRNYYDSTFADELALLVRQLRVSAREADEFKPDNPNIAFLVGALPGLFVDRKLFPKNEDIANFAEKVLKVNISRTEKRSQYELIGLIVCKVLRLDDAQLSSVVTELKRYVRGRRSRNSRDGMDWNDVIRRLSGEPACGSKKD